MADRTSISPPDYRAGIFDLDGVVTDTASVHFAAWKELFDDFLADRDRRDGEDTGEFTRADYDAYVDGRPRIGGITCFLEARGIAVGDDAVERLAAQKNAYFHRRLEADGVRVFDDAVAFVDRLRRAGLATAVVSSSKNCRHVLEVAGLTACFDTRVDGTDLGEAMRGKPAPDMFVEAARRLGVAPGEAFMAEDAVAGVEAGRAGAFRLVIGVARGTGAQALLDHGADITIDDFTELRIDTSDPEAAVTDALPDANQAIDRVLGRINGGQAAVFLDFDGTLAPIVERPEDAAIPDDLRQAVRELAQVCRVAIVSGRDLADVEQRAGVEGIAYAGSHGFEIETADGRTLNPTEADEYLDDLDEAERELRNRLEAIAGTEVERKRYSLAIHYRRVADDAVDQVRAHVGDVMDRIGTLRMTHGKKVFDLQPDLDWHKGRAVETLLEALGLDRPDVVPIYVGDDVTDEDAFETLAGRGVTVFVRGEGGQEQAARTAADFALDDPQAVGRFLERLSVELARTSARI